MLKFGVMLRPGHFPFAHMLTCMRVAEDAAVNVKRVRRYALGDYRRDDGQGLDFIESCVEIKTTWHPIGV